MKLTRMERLILRNQHEILAHLDPESADYHDKMIRIYEAGFEVEYEWKAAHVYPEENTLSEERCMFVIQSLAVHEALQRSVEHLGDASPVGAADVAFMGFDGNHETEYLAYARFLIEGEGKFEYLTLGGDGVNSHMPRVAKYERMIAAWEATGEGYDLTSAQVTAIYEA